MSRFRPETCFPTDARCPPIAFFSPRSFRSRLRVRSFAVSLGLATLPVTAVNADPPALGGGAVSSASSAINSQPGVYTDVVFGRNVKGPYLLSWKEIRTGSEIVTRDGVLLMRDSDYTFDPKSGALSFPAPISPSQIVRIVYAADTPDSKPNSSALNLPLQWTLWSRNKNLLSISSLYHPDASGGPGGTALATNIKFLGASRFARTSDVTSGLFFDLHGGDWLGRSGARFAEHTKWRNADLGASYAYAGALFGQSEASGLAAGREIMQANGTITPLSGLKLTGLVRETNELPDASKLKPGDPKQGKQTLESVQGLSLTLPEKGKVEANRGVTTVTQTNGDSVTTTIDALKLQRQIVQGTQATVGYEAQTIIPTSRIKGEEKDQGTYSQKTQVDVRSTPVQQLSVTGSFRNSLGGANAGDSQSLHLEATPFPSVKQFKVITGYEDVYQDSGVQRKREALIELPTVPLVRTQLSGGVQQFDNAGKEQIVGIVNAKSSPLRYVELNGSAKLRQGTLADSTPDPDIVNTYNLKFAVAPSRFLKLTGNVAHNPEADSGTIKRLLSQSVGLESDWGLFLFKGQYGTENAYRTAKLNSLLNIGVDMRLTKWDILTSAFEGRSQLDKDLTSTYTYRLGFTHRLGSAFDLNLSGSYTQTSLNGIASTDKPELKAEAKVGLRF